MSSFLTRRLANSRSREMGENLFQLGSPDGERKYRSIQYLEQREVELEQGGKGG